MLNIHKMEILDLMYSIFIRLSAEAILRIIDYSDEIKDKLTSFLKLRPRLKLKVDLSEFNLNTRMTLNDNNEYVFR